MKKLLLKLLLILLFIPFLFSCEKDDKSTYEIVNLSGVDWHDTQAWFADTQDAFISYEEVGNVMIGESFKVTTSNIYISINADNASGKLVMSDRVILSGNKVSIRQSDMLSW